MDTTYLRAAPVLDMLGVHEDYQRQGIAGAFILWGTDQADKDGLVTFLHGSEKGQPYYIKVSRCSKTSPDGLTRVGL